MITGFPSSGKKLEHFTRGINIGDKSEISKFIFEILYGHSPSMELSGGNKEIENKEIDNQKWNLEIPTDSIHNLIKLKNEKNITVISSSQGINSRQPAYIIIDPGKRFRRIEDIKKFTQSLSNKKDIVAGFERDYNKNIFIVGITGSVWFGKRGYDEWWRTLPIKIKQSWFE